MSENYDHYWQETLLPFAKRFPLHTFQGKKNCPIRYRHFTHDTPASSLLVIVNGRSENLYKWTEVAWDFYQQGFDILMLDHRGQGLSGRLLADKQKGYVDEFRYYADDLDGVVKQVRAQTPYATQYLLAHSMGSLIASQYLANYDHHIKKAVLCAPFWGVPTKHPVRDHLLVNLMMILGQGKRYVMGQGAYKARDPQNNDLSHSAKRVAWQEKLVQQDPTLALGGATYRWLHLCWQRIFDLPRLLARIEIPVFVLQAAEDSIVNNEDLPELVTYLGKGKHQCVAGAKHEILFETDAIRTPVLQQILQFFQES